MGATSAIISGANTLGQFAGQQRQASAITNQAGFDAQLASLNAKDAIARGNFEADQRGSVTNRTIGAQRAGLAASGIDPNTGTGAELQGDEAKFGALDAQQIRNNAAREAWGYTTQASLNTAGAEQEAAALKAQSYNTLLTGAVNTYGLYRDTRGGKNPTAGLSPKAPKGLGMKPGWK